jgi:hypothetical protein
MDWSPCRSSSAPSAERSGWLIFWLHLMSEIAPEYVEFLQARRRAQDAPPEDEAIPAGDAGRPIVATPGDLTKLISTAAKRAAGFFRPTRRTEVVWIVGDSQLAVGLEGIEVTTGDGLVVVRLPVRTDQTGRARVEVAFATGSDNQPAGLYAAAHPRPQGPALIVEAWGEHLVAFAWQCLLGVVAGLAGASGKDNRGNVLVPAEMVVNPDGITIVPMGRHRFAGSSGLATPGPTR